MRSGDLVSYCAEEGVRILGEGKFLVSDSFPGNERTKYCLTSKVYIYIFFLPLLCFSLFSFELGELWELKGGKLCNFRNVNKIGQTPEIIKLLTINIAWFDDVSSN